MRARYGILGARLATCVALVAVASRNGAAQAPNASRDSSARPRIELDTLALTEAISQPYWQLLARAPCPAAPWTPAAGGAGDAARLRQAFAARVGPIPSAPAGAVWTRRLLYDGPLYKIEVVVLTHRLPGALSYGLLATPKRDAPAPTVILIPGAGTTERMAFGWHFAKRDPVNYPTAPINELGTSLAERGYVVFVPFIRDDRFDLWPYFPWARLERQGAAYHIRTGGSPYGLVIGQLESALDFLDSEPMVDRGRIATVGWEEGADFATGLAILDRRVNGVLRLMPPIDRKRWRATTEGTRANPGMMQIDCTFGEGEQLAMLAPTPVRYDWAQDDPTFARHRFFVDSATLAPGRRVYQALGHRDGVSLVGRSVPPSVRHQRIVRWLSQVLGAGVDSTLSKSPPPPKPDPGYLLSLPDTVTTSMASAISLLGGCPPPQAKAPSVTSGLATFIGQADAYRNAVALSVGAPDTGHAAFRVLVRDTVEENADYTLEWIYTSQTASGLPLAGFLATPKFVEGLYPALLTFDGDFNAGEPFGLPPTGTSRYLKAYGKIAARRGVVVFAPAFPGWFGEGGENVLQARSPGGPNVWTITLAHIRAATDFLLSQPSIDSSRVTIQGLSYAGVIAVYAAAFDQRLTRLIYSNPVNTADSLFHHPDGMSLASWYAPVCGSLDNARKFLIAPRPFLWENGAHDDNGYEGSPLEAVRGVRAVYDALGIEDRFTFLRHNGGHEEMPDAVWQLDFYRARAPAQGP